MPPKVAKVASAPPLPPGVHLNLHPPSPEPAAFSPSTTEPSSTTAPLQPPSQDHLNELLTLSLDLLSASRSSLSLSQISTSSSYNQMAHAVLVKLGKWVDTAYVIRDESVEVEEDVEVEEEKMKVRSVFGRCYECCVVL